MSGIAGIFRRDGRPVPSEWLRAMLASIDHRGPDDDGIWSDGCIGLVQCAFHTTPESVHERQPLTGPDGTVVLAADARIDNRDALASKLHASTGRRGVVTDADLILAAYRKWGEGCAEHLVGAFAAVLWDGTAQRLVCLRDHAGLRPFYYYVSPSLFVFASEIKALFEVPGVPRRVNEARIAAHLTTVFPRDPTMTWFERITRMPPAHVLRVRREHVSLRRYWSLDPQRELRLSSDEEYTEAFREHFTEAVRCRLRRTTPAGSTLSGGIDSSSIACVARTLLQDESDEPLHTFSAVFPDVPEDFRSAIDEREYVEAVHQQGGFKAHFIRADQHSPLSQYDKIAWHLDEAIWAPNLYLHLGMYERAREQGVRVLLDGVDGDSVVSHGYEYLAELFYRKEWAALDNMIGALSSNTNLPPARYVREYLYGPLGKLSRTHGWLPFLQAVNQLSRRFDISRRELLSLHALSGVVDDTPLAFWRTYRHESGEEYPVLVRRDFLERMGVNGEQRGFADVLSDDFTTAREGHIHHLSDALFGPLFELADRASTAFDVEPRYPFFDRRLIEFCVALPIDQKIRDGWTRYILRRAMGGVLPTQIQWRKDKAHLGGNFVRNLWDLERDAIEQMIFNDVSVVAPYVNVSTLRTLYERAQQGTGNSNESRETSDLYTVLMLHYWLKREA